MGLLDLVEFPRPVKSRTPSRRHELRDDPDGRTTPEFKAKFAARMKALNADPEFKAKLSKAASARMKALNADPEFKAKTSARMKALNADPEFKAKTSARMKALHADPEFKAKTSARMKALNADPEFKAKVAATKLASKKKRMANKIAELKAELSALEGSE